MKASICTTYGGPEVLEIQEVEKPNPTGDQLLIKIHASSVTAADQFLRAGSPYLGRLFLGLTKPKHPITGTGFSGVVVGLGDTASEFKIGDEICGESIFGNGTNAEYTVVSEKGNIISKPQNWSHAEAAGICDGHLTSISMLKDIGGLTAGETILINGASGSLGSAAVQIAKNMGAIVIAVCSAKNAPIAMELGANKVIDYRTTDVSSISYRFDKIYDAVGKLPFAKAKKILKPGGTYISPVLSGSLLFQTLWSNIFGSKKAKFSATGMRSPEELRPLLVSLKQMIESKNLRTIIDRVYKMEEIAQAHAYVETGRKVGNIVLQN